MLVPGFHWNTDDHSTQEEALGDAHDMLSTEGAHLILTLPAILAHHVAARCQHNTTMGPWISPCKSCKSLCGPSTALPEALEHWGLGKGIQLTLKRWVSRPFSLAVVDPDLMRPTSVVALAPNINHESTIGPPRLSTAQFLVQTCSNIFFPQEEQVGLPATGGYHYFCMAMLSGKK